MQILERLLEFIKRRSEMWKSERGTADHVFNSINGTGIFPNLIPRMRLETGILYLKSCCSDWDQHVF